MPQAACRRYLWVIVSTIALFAVADMLLLPSSSIELDPGNAVELTDQVIFGASFFVIGKALGVLTSRSSGMLRDVLDLISIGLENAGIFLVLFFLFSAVDFLLMYLAADTSRPLMDADLAAIDRAFGFNWSKTVALFNSSALISSVMVFCYGALSYQIGLTALFHVLTNNRDRLFQFAAILVVSLLLTNAVMMAVPCEGAYAFYKPAPSSFNHFTAIGGFAHLSTLAELRSSAPFDFLFTKAIGLTCFPSFHAALGVMVTHALRRTILLPPIAAINVIMIAATIPEGGHYLVDVIGGLCVAVTSIVIVEMISRWAPNKLGSNREQGSIAAAAIDDK